MSGGCAARERAKMWIPTIPWKKKGVERDELLVSAAWGLEREGPGLLDAVVSVAWGPGGYPAERQSSRVRARHC